MGQLAEWVNELSPVRLLNRNNGTLSLRLTELGIHDLVKMLVR
tara:strand:+ start:361 stop:489 length:129 start_codon:yes stop_codon:yes gene_type:complete